MNGINSEKYQLKMKQLSSGQWLVDKLESHNDNVDELFKEVEDMMGKAEELLVEHNEVKKK
jgi:hypothetical protein